MGIRGALLPLALLGALSLGGHGSRAQQAPDPPFPGLDPTRPLTQLSLDRWTEADGLPQNFVTALAQTPEGYLWAGSERGLVRFDGLRFTVFTPENTPGLPSSWITALHVDPDGTLWIGTGGDGLTRYRRGVFEPVGGEALEGPVVSGILRDGEGRLWVATEGAGLFHLGEPAREAVAGEGPRRGEEPRREEGTEEEGTEAVRVEAVGTDEGLSAGFVTDLVEDPSGNLWVATPAGVDRLAPGGGSDLRVDPRVIAPEGVQVQALHVDSDGTLWLGTGGDGLLRYVDGEVGPVASDGALDGSMVTVLARDRAGALWIGTNGTGLFRKWDGTVERLPSRPELPTTLVQALLEDREGNLWIGLTAVGLARLQEGLFDAYGMPEGLSMNVALGILEARDGALWMGTPGEGVNRVGGGRVTTFGTADGLGSGFVMSVAEGPADHVWVGTMGGGVGRIADGAVSTFGPDDGLLDAQVSVVHWDAAGRLWVGYPGRGIQRWRPGPPRAYGVEDGLPNGAVTTVLDDARGRLWVGTRDGLARLDPGEGGGGARITAFTREHGLAHGLITGLHEDDDGGLWVATMGGLARIRDEEVTAAGPDIGLPPLEPMGVTEDGEGHLWISTNQGLLRVSRSALDRVLDGEQDRVEVTHFDRADGLRSAEANGAVHPSAWRGADGSLWFPTMAGAVRVDPDRTERPLLEPEPVVETLAVGDRTVPADDAATLPLGERTLEVRFSAPTFMAPEKVGLRYRLEGFDAEWRTAGEARTARYTNLPPGGYRFRLETAGRDGEWSGREAVVPVDVPPHVHERPLVRAAGLVLVLFLVGAGYRARVRGMEKREEELMQAVEDRQRALEALERSEERLRLALEAGRMGTWEWDLETDEVRWSEGSEELLGPAPDSGEELGRRLTREARGAGGRGPAEELDEVREGRRTAVQAGFALSRTGESTRHIDLRGRRVADGGDGERRRMIGVAADVSDLIRTQEALRARETELRQAQKMEAVGRLAGGVAHDFNNLLAVIGMNVHLALDSVTEGTSAHEELREALRAAERAAELTRQLLQFSRKQKQEPRVLDLNRTVQEVERMLRRLVQANIELHTRLDPELAAVRADPGGIEQILVNLVVNAQDAMPDGGEVRISTENGEADPDARNPVRERPHVVLAVADTGRGMDAETRRRAFEPFFTTKGLGEGTGLGLATVYGIVQQNDGHVDVTSRPGEGTAFRIYFPRVEEGTGDGARDPRHREGDSGGSPAGLPPEG